MVNDKPSELEASRFAVQSTFGADEDDIGTVVAQGYSAWFRDQLQRQATSHEERISGIDFREPRQRHIVDSWWVSTVDDEDQLRQRMAFALSQIFVISYDGGAQFEAAIQYTDMLNRSAFGNFRDLLESVTYSQAMGRYLTYAGNQKANPQAGTVPDENYAREILQLFSIGLVELNPDGTEKRGADGQSVETYGNEDIIQLAKVFTGLSYPTGRFRDGSYNPTNAERYGPMKAFEAFHDTTSKTVLGRRIPAGQSIEKDIDDALDIIFEHPNVGPFIGKQLIQRFVTSNPSPAYVARVTQAFDQGGAALPDGSRVGTGQRGDLAATLAAVLFDPEARDMNFADAEDFGKVREPLLRIAQWLRAFDRPRDGLPQSGKDGTLIGTDRFRFLQEPTSVAQMAYRSPSVFNFYRPGYVDPGSATGGQGLLSPELQITNAATIVGYLNLMHNYIENGFPGNSGFFQDYSDEAALAEDPQTLVEHLDTLLTYGRMSDETKQRIVEAVNAVAIDASNRPNSRNRRARLAITMAVSSPEYITQQ